MTDEELVKNYQRVQEIRPLIRPPQRPSPALQLEFAALIESLFAEVRIRAPEAIKRLEEAQAQLPEGEQAGFDLFGVLDRLVRRIGTDSLQPKS